MSNPPKIVQRIEADVDDAIRDTKRTSQEIRGLGDATTDTGQKAGAAGTGVRKLGDTTEDTGKKTEKAGRDIEQTTGRIGRMRESVAGMVGSWVSFTAIIGTITAGFRDIAGAARDALNAVVDLGKNIRGLSANIGGALADEVVTDINEISLAQGFDKSGRDQLIAAIAAQTDVNPDLGRAELRRSAERLAQLQRATGVGGEAGFDVVQSLEATFGLTQQQAVDQAAVLLNSGLGASTIQDLAEKAGPVGGQELFARLLAARGEVNLGRAGRALPTIISALTRRDESGGLSEDLTGVGITEDQTLVQRIDLLSASVQSGQISQGQFEKAIGGAQNLRLFAPLARARGRQAEASRALRTGTAVDEINKLRQSETVRIAERQQQRELRQVLVDEGGAGSGFVEGFEDFKIELEEGGGGSKTIGLLNIGSVATEGTDRTTRLQGQLDRVGVSPFEQAGQGQQVTVINNNNFGTTINNGRDPLTSDLREGRPRR